MKIFELSLDGYDLYSPILFYNPNKSDDDFRTDVKNALNSIVDNIENYEMLDISDLQYEISEILFKNGYEELEKSRISFNDSKGLDGCNEIKSMLTLEKLKKIHDHNEIIEKKEYEDSLNDIEWVFHYDDEKINIFKELCLKYNQDYLKVFETLSIELKTKAEQNYNLSDMEFFFFDDVLNLLKKCNY